MRKVLRPARKLVHIGNRVILKGHSIGTKVEQRLSEVVDSGASFTRSNKTRDIHSILFGANRDLYNSDSISPALPKTRKPTVNLFVPTIDKSAMFGGIATAIRVAETLAQKKKYKLRIVCVDRPGTLEHANSFLKSVGGKSIEKEDIIDVSSRQGVAYGYIDLHPDDINIATAWWTAKILIDMKLKKPFIYLIQDFEPIFYSYSDLYVDAKNSYEEGNYIALCNTKLVQDYLLSHGFSHIKNRSVFFEPAVDRSVFFPREINTNKKQKKQLFIYARPNVSRNLYLHSLRLLDDAFTEGILKKSEWELYMAGQDKAPNIKLSNGLVINNLGKLTFNQYAEFAGTIDLAISLMMAPHPSYPPLEMAVSGAVVVSNKYDIKTDLSMYSKNIFLGDLNPNSLLETLKNASQVPKEISLKNALESRVQKNWEEALRDPINELITKL